MKSALFAVLLATLAIPVVAQNTVSAQPKASKPAASEASSLERKEAGPTTEERDTREDNRGRLTSARHSQHKTNQVSKATDHHKHIVTAHAQNTNPQHHAAQLKTGQLTTSQSSHLKTKEAAFHQIPSEPEQDRKRTTEDPAQTTPPQDKNTAPIHLKKHNARMF